MTPSASTPPQTGANYDLLDQLVDGAFALTDARGKIVKWTEGASVLLGWLPAEVIGRSSFDAPLVCDQPDLGSEWTAYLARETEEVPSSEVDVVALRRDGGAQRISIAFIPVGLELGLEVNFFLKALGGDLPRDTKVDYLRREHSTVVETLTDCHERGPEATAGQTIAGVLLLMQATGEPVAASDEQRNLADDLRIEPADERSSSAIIPGPPLPMEVPDAPTFTAPAADAPDSLVEARERLERARLNEQDARRRVGELEGLLDSAETLAAESRKESDRTAAELAAVASDREQLRERLAAARAEREQARERYEQAEQDAESLRDRIEDTDFAARQAQLEAKEAQEELARRLGEDADLRAKLEELENENAGGRQRLERLSDDLETVTRRAGALEADLARSADESAELREALASGTEQAKRSEAERLLAVERADALQDALDQVRAAAVDATRWLDGGLAARLETVLAELSSTRHDAAELRSRLAAGMARAPERQAEPRPARAAQAPEPAVEAAAPPAVDSPAGEASSEDADDDADENDGPCARARIRPDGRFVELSPAFCELFGYPEAELKRAMWPPATDRERAPQLRELTRRVVEGELEEARVETEYIDAHGAPVRLVGTLSRIGGAEGADGFIELTLDAE